MQPKRLSSVVAVLAALDFAAIGAIEVAPPPGRSDFSATDRLPSSRGQESGTSQVDVARSRVAGSIDEENIVTAETRLKNKVRRAAAPVYRLLDPGAIAVLRPAFGWARIRAQHTAKCRGLFEELGADPLAVFSSTEYTGPQSVEEKTVCRERNAVAHTSVGPGPVVLCPRFEVLEVGEAAAYLIHEALHNAGQTEWPVDPQAPTSKEIQTRVRKQCRL